MRYSKEIEVTKLYRLASVLLYDSHGICMYNKKRKKIHNMPATFPEKNQ